MRGKKCNRKKQFLQKDVPSTANNSENKLKELEQKEEKLIDQLKRIYDENGKEENPTKTAHIFHKLSQVYHHRGLDFVSVIRSAVLYNAALIRATGKKRRRAVRRDLLHLGQDVLKAANAKVQNAKVVEQSRKIKKSVTDMRAVVTKKLRKLQYYPRCSRKKKIIRIQKLQAKITTDYTNIMIDVAKYCQYVMGEPPCQFALLGMGSIARKEVTPYSDFENILVLEEGCQSWKNYDSLLRYFRWFSVIFQIVLINLQETIVPCVNIPLLNDQNSKYGDWFFDRITPRGISFDGMMPHACKFPLGRQQLTENKRWKTELIKPVSEMLEYLNEEENLKNGYHLGDILTKTCHIYGDVSISEEFQCGVASMLDELDDNSRMVEIRKQIVEDLNKFATRSTLLQIKLENRSTSKKTSTGAQQFLCQL